MPSFQKTDATSIVAKPSTDIWRKPPATNSTNGELEHLADSSLSGFRRAQISILNDNWRYRYDQGGLYLKLTQRNEDPQHVNGKWLKIGIEFFNEKPYISTVGTDLFSDWSIYPCQVGLGEYVTVEVKREEDENGKALWCYLLSKDQAGNVTARTPLREIAWFFADEDSLEVAFFAYAARPSKGGDGQDRNLEVVYKDVEIDFS